MPVPSLGGLPLAILLPPKCRGLPVGYRPSSLAIRQSGGNPRARRPRKRSRTGRLVRAIAAPAEFERARHRAPRRTALATHQRAAARPLLEVAGQVEDHIG